MLTLCDRWQTENIHSFSPKVEAVNDFHEHAKKILRNTVWAEDCRSWYKNHGRNAKALSIWPGSGLHYIEAIQEYRADHWHIRYNGNMFSWLGNGFSQTEADPDSDLAYYLRLRDDGPYLSKDRRLKVLTRRGASTSTRMAGHSIGEASSAASDD